MESLATYIPKDRCQALARGEDLPERTRGAALFADISGFTPLTEALVKELGPRHGADELIRELNIVYGALIAEVHRHRGSVIGFSGDAITCWFDGDDGLRATACALAMQQGMSQFAQVQTPSGTSVSLAVKVAIAVGPVRRFLVGDPKIQVIDVLAGTTLDRMAKAEKQAKRGEVVLAPEASSQLLDRAEILEWRDEAETGRRFAVVAKLLCQVETAPGPDLPFPEGEISAGQLRPWLLPPVYERLRTGQDRFLAEIRPAVALFLRFAGLDYDRDDAAGEKLNAYIQWIQSILTRYEGYLLDITIGDKGSYLYAAFGAPLAHDDDPIRAVAAAIELRSPSPGMDYITRVQIGISRGRMRVGAAGSLTRRTYGVLGAEVNIAARLMSKAEPGQVLVSQRVANAAARSYHFRYLGPVELKGKQDPLPVYAVQDSRVPSRQRPATIFTHVLVGRDDELAQMQAVLASAVAGKGQVLRLEGAAGVGKSHLAAEFVERAMAEGIRVALGTCQNISQDISYYPWRQVFRALFGLAEGLREEDAGLAVSQQIARLEAAITDTNAGWLLRLPLLGDLVGLPIHDNETTAAFSPQLRQAALFALATEALQAWATHQPLLLMIEDAHWMDEASQRLTLAVGRAIASAPILLVLVHRPPVREDRPLFADLDRSPYCNHLRLGDLPSPGVALLVRNRLQGQPVTALALSLIQSLAQGNPFFTEEVVDALRESGSLCLQDDSTWTLSETIFKTLRAANCLVRDAASGEWALAPGAQVSDVDLGVPDSIEGVVLSRIDRLPEAHKLTLKVASVIGRTFEFDLLARSHPMDHAPEVLLEQIRVLEARDFTQLEEPPPRSLYMFKHNITQEVTYDTLLENQQRELHRAVGQALESLRSEAVEQLAYHYSRGDLRDKALCYLDKAARKAQRECANETALNYYNQALALEQRWEWVKGKAETLHVLGRRDEERAALVSLEQISEAPGFDTAYLWGQYHEAVGDYAQARVSVEQARIACAGLTDNKVGEARCLTQLGLIGRRQGDYEQAKDWYGQALELLQGKDTRFNEEAQALNGLGTVHRQQGDYDKAMVCYQRAWALSYTSGNRMGEAEAFNNLGVTAFYQCDFDQARTYHQQALEMRRSIGDRAGEGASLCNLAGAMRDAGDYGQAWDHLSAALAIQQAIGNRWDEANVWNGTGIIYLLVGDLPEARACFERGLKLSQELGDEAGQAYFLGNLGLVVRDQGNLAEAEKLLTEGLALAQKQAERHVIALFLSHLAIVSLLVGNLDQTVERANAALTMRRELDLTLWATADLTTLASAYLARGDTAQALDCARQALSILDGCGGEGPEYPHRDYYVCYQVLSASGQEEAARSALQSAYNLVMARAEKIIDPALRRSFLERVEVNREIVQDYEERGTMTTGR